MMKSDQNPPTKRVIVDFKKLNDEILELLVSRYPDGYTSKDIIRFKNAAGEWIECAEVRTEDTIYLVKVSRRLEDAMSEYEDDGPSEDDEFDDEEDDYEEDEDENDSYY
jgi:hypothetical protein